MRKGRIWLLAAALALAGLVVCFPRSGQTHARAGMRAEGLRKLLKTPGAARLAGEEEKRRRNGEVSGREPRTAH